MSSVVDGFTRSRHQIYMFHFHFSFISFINQWNSVLYSRPAPPHPPTPSRYPASSYTLPLPSPGSKDITVVNVRLINCRSDLGPFSPPQRLSPILNIGSVVLSPSQRFVEMPSPHSSAAHNPTVNTQEATALQSPPRRVSSPPPPVHDALAGRCVGSSSTG